jgi:outer membrane protein assembly factor BamB
METHGILVCRDAKTGKKFWEHTWEAEFQASPALAGDRLYLSTTEGATYVLASGKEFKELAHNKLADPVHASPAFGDGRIYIRGATNLYCIAAPGGTK